MILLSHYLLTSLGTCPPPSCCQHLYITIILISLFSRSTFQYFTSHLFCSTFKTSNTINIWCGNWNILTRWDHPLKELFQFITIHFVSIKYFSLFILFICLFWLLFFFGFSLERNIDFSYIMDSHFFVSKCNLIFFFSHFAEVYILKCC